MKKRKIVAMVLACAIAFAAFAGCNSAPSSSGGGTEPAAGMYPGTADADMVTIDVMTEPPDMNTILTTDSTSFSILKNTMENLVRLDEQDLPQPGAAESWDISEDKLTYVFHLREGMKWENGDPVTAADFEFAWKEAMNPEVAAEYAYFFDPIVGAKDYYSGTGSRDDVKVTATDELTLEVVLTAPTEYFLGTTAFGTMSPVNQKFYEEVGADKFGTEAEYLLSNGPFKVVSWTHESNMMLEKNENYFNADQIKLEKVKLIMINDNNARLNSFQAGEMDLATLSLGTQVKQVEATGYEVQQYSDGATFYLEMNLLVPVLENRNIRKAINYALDRQTFIDTVMQNSSLPATSLVPPNIIGKSKSFPEELGEMVPIAGDEAKAKEYLEAGLKELNMTAAEVAAELTMITDDSDTAMNVGAFIKEQLNSKLGLDITIESMPFKSRLDRMTNKDFSLVMAGWGPDYNDPNTFLDLFVTGNGNNHTSYSNPEYDQLVKDAAAELDPDARMEIFYEIEKLIAEDCMITPVYWRIRDFVTSEKLEGVYRTALQDLMFMNAYIVE